MSATVVRLPDGNRGRQLLAELQRRLPFDLTSELRIRSYAGQAMLFVPDAAWRETWIEELMSRHGATVVAFDVPATVVDRALPRIVIETVEPEDVELRDHVAVLLLRHRLMPMPEAGNAEAATMQLLRDVASELETQVPDASIEAVSVPPDEAAGAAGAAGTAERAVVWRVSRRGARSGT